MAGMPTRSWLLVLFAALCTMGYLGCDSNDDEASDAAAFVGDWALAEVRLNDAPFNVLALAQIDGIDVTFEQGGAFQMLIRADSGATEIDGTYSLDEGQNTVTLQSGEFQAPIVMDYEMRENGGKLALETEDVGLLVALSGIDPADIPIQIDHITLVLNRTAGKR